MTDEPRSQEELVEATLEISKAISLKLSQKKSTLMVAESATGGLIQHFLTEIPGSSAFFLGGVIAYSNALKEKLLQVRNTVLYQYGAVSEETTASMAAGVRLLMNADYGLATSGIAGPSGARADKPVGLVYVAVSHLNFETIIKRYVFKGSRSSNKLFFSHAALQLLLEAVDH
ncbi:MAG: CinA family protein [Candidatus Thorarchaeota archaeon]